MTDSFMRTKLIISIVSFLAGLLVYDIFLVDLYLATKTPTDTPIETICPTRSSFTTVWEAWTNEFIAENPGAGAKEQLQEWNSLMVGIGCPEWVDPFKNVEATTTVTNTQGSTTEVYQYKLPE